MRGSIFGTLAERLAGELKKLDKVYVEGHWLRLSKWTSRTAREMCTGLQMVGSKVEKIGTAAIGRNRSSRWAGAKDASPAEHQHRSDRQAPL